MFHIRKSISFLPLWLALAALLSEGCKVHRTLPLEKPPVCIPESFLGDDAAEGAQVGRWWEQYGSESLNTLVECALSRNLDLRQSWWRVAQSCYQAKIQGVARYPEI